MGDFRDGPVKIAIQQDLFGGGGDPFFSPKDVTYLHEVVVNNHGKVVSGQTVGFNQNLIVNIIGAETDFTPNLVVKRNGLIVWDFKTNNILGAMLNFSVDFRRGQRSTTAIIFWHLSAGFLDSSHFSQTSFGAKTVISQTLSQQFPDVFLVNSQSFGLNIGAIWTSDVGTFIPA
jgi:hypothetical protein